MLPQGESTDGLVMCDCGNGWLVEMLDGHRTPCCTSTLAKYESICGKVSHGHEFVRAPTGDSSHG